MDPKMCRAVTEAFVRLHEDGTIYRYRQTMFRIRDILVRIRIHGSVPLIQIRIPVFSSVTFKITTKKVFCLIIYEGKLQHSSQIRIHKLVTKEWKSRVFLLFLLVDGNIRIRSSD
jgi:hypothetical protein